MKREDRRQSLSYVIILKSCHLPESPNSIHRKLQKAWVSYHQHRQTERQPIVSGLVRYVHAFDMFEGQIHAEFGSFSSVA